MLLEHSQWYLQESKTSWRLVTVNMAKDAGNHVLASLVGVDDRELAYGLQGKTVGLPRSKFAKLPEGEYYWCDLLGLEVLDASGACLGQVLELQTMPAGDLLKVGTGGEVLLIPFKEPYVTDVDFRAGKISTVWRADY